MNEWNFDNIFNFREIGGLQSNICGNDGRKKYMHCGMFFRSALPIRLSSRDFDTIKKLQIQTVIDLRTPDELKLYPIPIMLQTNMDYYNIDLLDGKSLGDDLAASYIEIVENYSSIKKILNIIHNTSGPVLIGCGLGKDRTGVISALLQLIAGIRRSEIIYEYSLSSKLLAPYLGTSLKINGKIRDSAPEIMEHFINYLFDNYGGIADYCRALGYSEENILKLQGNLLTYECWDAFDSKENMIMSRLPKNDALIRQNFHKVINVWIISGNKVLITKRAQQKYCGGTWECCGGSVLSGECETRACYREAFEEVGVRLQDLQLIDKTIDEHKIVYTYVAHIDYSPVNINIEEISEYKFVSMPEIKSLMESCEFMPAIAGRFFRYQDCLTAFVS